MSDIGSRLKTVAATWAHCQARIVALAAEFADSGEWALDGYPTAAAWIADTADVEPSTAREWIRIGMKLLDLPHIGRAFADGDISYSKVRALTRVATPDDETELLDLALSVPAAGLAAAIAAWMNQTKDSDEIAAHQHQHRSVTWRVEPDGMVLFTLRLPPWIAAKLIAVLTTLLMTTRLHTAPGERATVAQQHADNLDLFLDRQACIDTEIVIHVRSDGCTLDDGTPIPGSAVEALADTAFIRALIHDIDGNPIDATNRRRHPTDRQKRVVKQRDRVCVDCGRTDLLEYDHTPAHHHTGHTITQELELRCAPCHHARQPPPQWLNG